MESITSICAAWRAVLYMSCKIHLYYFFIPLCKNQSLCSTLLPDVSLDNCTPPPYPSLIISAGKKIPLTLLSKDAGKFQQATTSPVQRGYLLAASGMHNHVYRTIVTERLLSPQKHLR